MQCPSIFTGWQSFLQEIGPQIQPQKTQWTHILVKIEGIAHVVQRGGHNKFSQLELRAGLQDIRAQKRSHFSWVGRF